MFLVQALLGTSLLVRHIVIEMLIKYLVVDRARNR